jgi:hypothetical protein
VPGSTSATARSVVSDDLRPEPAPRAEPARSEPERQNSSESGVESEPVEAAEHDKRGLELAKTLASRLKNAGPIQPVKKTRRRRPTGNQVSSARADDRDPQLLTNTLGRLMREQGWEVDVAVHGVMARWPSITASPRATRTPSSPSVQTPPPGPPRSAYWPPTWSAASTPN